MGKLCTEPEKSFLDHSIRLNQKDLCSENLSHLRQSSSPLATEVDVKAEAMRADAKQAEAKSEADKGEYAAPASVPVIDIREDDSIGRTRAVIALELRHALETWGGFLCVGHGVDAGLCERMFALSTQFFALPQDVKDVVHVQKGGAAWRGYMPYGGERSQNGTIEDFKEG